MKKSIFILATILIFASCEEDDISSNSPLGGSLEEQENNEENTKTSDFNSPEEFMKNPSVYDAIDESDIEITLGEDYPALAGDYGMDGMITKASSGVSSLRGQKIKSLFTLYNQTYSGNIDFREKIDEATVFGTGGYITGAYGKFSIWLESSQTGEEAGLPEDIIINVALIISGTKLSNGNLEAKGISIITDIQTENPNYNVETLLSVYWMWEADLELLGEANSTRLTMKSSNIGKLLFASPKF